MLRPKVTVQSIGDEICANAVFTIAPYHLSETEVDQIRQSAGSAVSYDFTRRVLTIRARYVHADPSRAGLEFGKMLDRAEKALNKHIEQKDAVQNRFLQVVTRIIGNLE